MITLLLCPFNSGRVGKAPVDTLWVTWKGRAFLKHTITERNNAIKELSTKLVNMFWSLLADVKADSSESTHSIRMEARRVAPCTIGFNLSFAEMPHESFSHL
jgi:hypothetical protein